jgi:hypothetical protein
VLEVVRTIASLGTLLSVGVAIYVIRLEERRRSNQAVYERIGAEWVEFLRHAFDHPEHDPMNIEVTRGGSVSADETRRTALNALFATMVGRAWLAYRDQPEPVRANRWSGWELFLERWARRPDFVDFWRQYGGEYDVEFVSYVNQKFGWTTEHGNPERDRPRSSPPE